MKSSRLMLSAVLMLFAIMAFAQSDAHKCNDKSAPSEAQKSFDTLKTLAGTWQGPVTADPPQPDWGDKPVQVSLRVTSRGNALVHEMKEAGTPDDPGSHAKRNLYGFVAPVGLWRVGCHGPLPG